MTSPSLWNQFLIWPIVNLLVAFYKLFEFFRIPGALGFAIILMTAVVRAILYPLMSAQMRSAKKMANLKPHLDALTAKHKDDKQGLQQAQLALYKEHGVNPAAGCLPLLVQFPVLIALYNVFYQVFSNGDGQKLVAQINQIVYLPALRLTNLDLTFFGVNLGVKPGEWQKYGWWLLTVPLITALLQWYQTKLMLPQTAAVKPIAKDTGAAKGEAEKKPADTAGEMQKQMALITPIMFGFFAFQFPLGLSLYWNVFSLFGIMQQLQINKRT